MNFQDETFKNRALEDFCFGISSALYRFGFLLLIIRNNALAWRRNDVTDLNIYWSQLIQFEKISIPTHRSKSEFSYGRRSFEIFVEAETQMVAQGRPLTNELLTTRFFCSSADVVGTTWEYAWDILYSCSCVYRKSGGYGAVDDKCPVRRCPASSSRRGLPVYWSFFKYDISRLPLRAIWR